MGGLPPCARCSESIVVCLTCARHAQVEGPFTWEQMRHWLQAGYFDTDKLLVRNPRVQRGTYQHFSEAFPDSKRAFLPASMGDRIAAAAAAVGTDGGGGVGSPGRASGAGLYVASCSLCLLVFVVPHVGLTFRGCPHSASTAAAEAGVDPDDPYVLLLPTRALRQCG